MELKKTWITKRSGSSEIFSIDKLIRSLKRAGAKDDIISHVVQEITSNMREGMSTREIYSQAFELMRQYSPPQAARYKLKSAINELGPSGFPFEFYIAELLQAEGYKTQVSVIMQGRCVKHEVDVVARKGEVEFLIECKFHNIESTPTDIKVPLYIQSRFLDLESAHNDMVNAAKLIVKPCIATNTRFTVDATSFATCMGITIISWDYPKHASLRDRINAAGLHPLTCLTTITNYEKKMLLEKGIVLCRRLCDEPDLLKGIGIVHNERLQKILSEAQQVCAVQ